MTRNSPIACAAAVRGPGQPKILAVSESFSTRGVLLSFETGSSIYAAATAPGRRSVAAGDKYGVVKIAVPGDDSLGTVLEVSLQNTVTSLAFVTDQQLLAAGVKGRIHAISWEVDGEPHCRLLHTNSEDGTITNLFPLSATQFGFLTTRGHFRIIDQQDGSDVFDRKGLSVLPSDSRVQFSAMHVSACMHPNTRSILIASTTGQSYLYDMQSATLKETQRLHEGHFQVAPTPDGRLVTAGTFDREIRLWSPEVSEYEVIGQSEDTPLNLAATNSHAMLVAHGPRRPRATLCAYPYNDSGSPIPLLTHYDHRIVLSAASTPPAIHGDEVAEDLKVTDVVSAIVHGHIQGLPNRDEFAQFIRQSRDKMDQEECLRLVSEKAEEQVIPTGTWDQFQSFCDQITHTTLLGIEDDELMDMFTRSRMASYLCGLNENPIACEAYRCVDFRQECRVTPGADSLRKDLAEWMTRQESEECVSLPIGASQLCVKRHNGVCLVAPDQSLRQLVDLVIMESGRDMGRYFCVLDVETRPHTVELRVFVSAADAKNYDRKALMKTFLSDCATALYVLSERREITSRVEKGRLFG